MERSVLAMLSLAHRAEDWQPPIIKTVATQGQGVAELQAAIRNCYAVFQKSEQRKQKKHDDARQRLITLLEERLVHKVVQQVFPDGELNKVIEEIADRRKDPYSIVENIIQNSQFRKL